MSVVSYGCGDNGDLSAGCFISLLNGLTGSRDHFFCCSSILSICSLILLLKFSHLALLHSVGLWYFHAHFKIFLTAYVCLCIYVYLPIYYTHMWMYVYVYIYENIYTFIEVFLYIIIRLYYKYWPTTCFFFCLFIYQIFRSVQNHSSLTTA